MAPVTTARSSWRRIPWRWILAALIVLLLMGSILRGMIVDPSAPNSGNRRQSQRHLTPKVGVDRRFAAPKGAYIAGNGVIEPRVQETRVAAAVAGRIAAIKIHEGQKVELGAILLSLDSSVERAALNAADADVKRAQAELLRLVNGARREEVQSAIAVAAGAQARAKLSQDTLQRTEAVSASGGISKEEMERVRRLAEVDQATAQQAEAQRQLTVEGSRKEDIQNAQAALAAAEARRAQSQEALDRLTIRAPIAGEILQVKYRVGEFYQPGAGEPLVVLGDTSELHARMDVDERDLAYLQTGATAIIRAPAFPNFDVRGQLIEIGRRMGRKNVRTDDPTELNDVQILEAVIRLNDPYAKRLIVGQRVVCYLAKRMNSAR